MTFAWPIADPVITRGFYYPSSIYIGGMHAALDIVPCNRPAVGEPAKAIADWKAVGVGWDFYSGFFTALDLAEGWRCFYRHLYGQSPVVIGQRGKQGDIVGNIGNTGYSLGAHLHFDLWNRVKQDASAFWKNGWWAHNPELYLGLGDDMTPGEYRAIAKEEADKAVARLLNAREQGSLARALGAGTLPDLAHAISGAAVAGAPAAQPSAIVWAVRGAVKAHVLQLPHGGGDLLPDELAQGLKVVWEP